MTTAERSTAPTSSRRPARECHETSYDHLEPHLAQFAALSLDDPCRRVLCEELITGFLPVVRHIARRYRGRGEPSEDLEQAGSIGLLNALERFVPMPGIEDYVGAFLGYAVPTITGEIQRHFRDRTWAMRVPRRLKDLQLPLRSAVSVLSHRMKRAPRPTEIAAYLQVDVGEVIEALQAQHAHTPVSADAINVLTDTAIGAGLGWADPALGRVVHRPELAQAFRLLSHRDRQILGLRFFADMTQTEIAQELGISQMHVSRLLTRSLAALRKRLDTPHDLPQQDQAPGAGAKLSMAADG